MQTTTTLDEKHPFHETIVEAIGRCGSPSTGEILRLFQLIKKTKIPKGHDEIIAAIDKFFDFPGSGKWAHEIMEVKESVLSQKPTGKVVETEDNLDNLNTQVTAAILEFQDVARRLSRIEGKIANLTAPSSVEGDIARRGAVKSALDGKEEGRARELAKHFLSETGAQPLLRKQLGHMFLFLNLDPP